MPFFRWVALATAAERQAYVFNLLRCGSVWDCLSLDMAARDAAPSPPANLAHLSPAGTALADPETSAAGALPAAWRSHGRR